MPHPAIEKFWPQGLVFNENDKEGKEFRLFLRSVINGDLLVNQHEFDIGRNGKTFHLLCTPLCYVIQHGNAELVRAFIAMGADVCLPSVDKSTPLGEAVKKGHVDMVNILMEHGADMNIPTTFSSAIKNGQPRIVSAFIQAGAQMDEKDLEGLYPLAVAADHKRIMVAKTMMDAGANLFFQPVVGGFIMFASKNPDFKWFLDNHPVFQQALEVIVREQDEAYERQNPGIPRQRDAAQGKNKIIKSFIDSFKKK